MLGFFRGDANKESSQRSDHTTNSARSTTSTLNSPNYAGQPFHEPTKPHNTYTQNTSGFSSQASNYSYQNRSTPSTNLSYSNPFSKLPQQSPSYSHQAPLSSPSSFNSSITLSAGQLDTLREYEGKLRSAFDELNKAQQQVNLTRTILESLTSSYSSFVQQFSPDLQSNGGFNSRNNRFQHSPQSYGYAPPHTSSHNPPTPHHNPPMTPPYTSPTPTHNPQTSYHNPSPSSMPYSTASHATNPHSPIPAPSTTYSYNPGPVTYSHNPGPITHPHNPAPPAYQHDPPSIYPHSSPALSLHAPAYPPTVAPSLSNPTVPSYAPASVPDSALSVQKVEPPKVPKPKRALYVGLCSPSDSDIWENIRCLKSLENKINSHFDDANFVLTTETRSEIDLYLYCIRADTRILIEEENPPVEKKNVVTVVFLNRTDRLTCNVSQYHSGIHLQSSDEKRYFFQFSYKGGEEIEANKDNLTDLDSFFSMLKDFFEL